MKKRYLKTLKLEEVLQKLKAGQYIFVDDEDDHYITMVDDVICERSKYGWKVNKEFFMNGNCYFEEDECMQEATEDDIDKLCKFWDNNENNFRISILRSIKIESKTDYPFSDDFDDEWLHCRRLTPSEISELTGYFVEERKKDE